jgi:hypothetical protein
MTTEPKSESSPSPSAAAPGATPAVPEPIIAPRLRREPNGDLTLLDGDRQVATGCGVERCFPWSLPDEYLSIRDKDGKELLTLRRLADSPEDVRRLVSEELGVQEFIPRIRRILSVEDSFDVMIWKVETDRGPIEFLVKEDEDIRALEDDRAVIRDHRGMVFEIPSLSALDPRSRAFVEDRSS